MSNKAPPRVAFNFEPDLVEEEPVIEPNTAQSIEEQIHENIIDTLDEMSTLR